MKHKLTLSKNKYQTGKDVDLSGLGSLADLAAPGAGQALNASTTLLKGLEGDGSNKTNTAIATALNPFSGINALASGRIDEAIPWVGAFKKANRLKKEADERKLKEQGMIEQNSIAQARANANPNTQGNRLTSIYELGGWIDYDKKPASKKPYLQLGAVIPESGGQAIPLNNSGDVLYKGNQHSEGGIKLANAEVENGEVAVNTNEGTIIKSDILIDPQDPNKRTFAEIAQERAMKKGMIEQELLKLQSKIGKKEFISNEDNVGVKVLEQELQAIEQAQLEAAERQEMIKQETQQVEANSPEAQEGLRNGGQRMEFNNVQPGQQFTGEGMDRPLLMQLGTQKDGYVDIKDEKIMNPGETITVPQGVNKVIEQKMKYGGKLQLGFSDKMLELKKKAYSQNLSDVDRQKYYTTELQKMYPDYSTWNKEASKYAKEYNFPQVGTANNNWNSFQNMSRSFIDAFNSPQPINKLDNVNEYGVPNNWITPPTVNIQKRGENIEPLAYKNPTEDFLINERLYNNKPQPNNIGKTLKGLTLNNVPVNQEQAADMGIVSSNNKVGKGLLNVASNADIIAGIFNQGRDKAPPMKNTTGYINPNLEQYNDRPIKTAFRQGRLSLNNLSAQNQNNQLMNLATQEAKQLADYYGQVNNRNLDRRNQAQGQNIQIEAGNNQTMYDNQANQVKFANDKNAKLQQLASQISARSQSRLRDINANELANRQLDLYNNYFKQKGGKLKLGKVC